MKPNALVLALSRQLYFLSLVLYFRKFPYSVLVLQRYSNLVFLQPVSLQTKILVVLSSLLLQKNILAMLHCRTITFLSLITHLCKLSSMLLFQTITDYLYHTDIQYIFLYPHSNPLLSDILGILFLSHSRTFFSFYCSLSPLF